MVGLALLKKALPDMQSLEISGNQDQPITVSILRFADPVAEDLAEGLTAQAARPAEPLVIDLQPEAFEAQIEANPRLIEDEPSSPRTSSKRARSKG